MPSDNLNQKTVHKEKRRSKNQRAKYRDSPLLKTASFKSPDKVISFLHFCLPF